MSFGGIVIMLVAMRHAALLAGNNPAASTPAAATAGMHELFPGVRADLNAHVMEFDSQITPMLVKDDRAPLFFLEVLGCSPNTREHETFVVINAKPSHIHAAMLAIGLNPGAPGFWTLKDGALIPHQPTGDRLRVRFVYTDKDGKQTEQDPLDWIVNAKGKSHFVDAEKKVAADQSLAAPGWIFAGSKFVKRKSPDGAEAARSTTPTAPAPSSGSPPSAPRSFHGRASSAPTQASRSPSGSLIFPKPRPPTPK